MKKIVLTRHAKPDYSSSLTDSELKISDQGRKEQSAMIERLRFEGIFPNLIYHSPLKRTAETAELIAEAFECPLLEEPALFEFDFEKLLLLIEAASDGECLVFVGHAPSLREFYSLLTKERGGNISFGMSSYKVIEI